MLNKLSSTLQNLRAFSVKTPFSSSKQPVNTLTNDDVDEICPLAVEGMLVLQQIPAASASCVQHI